MEYRPLVSKAIEHFWRTRLQQFEVQGSGTSARDAGNRSAVTGGKQLDGFVELISSILEDAGLSQATIHTNKTVLPGYFRPTKNWDVVVVTEDTLIATIELKSHVGPSFGNNFNNRIEEAIGCATDIWTAYREGIFKPSQRPWVGWMMILEDAPKSRSPVKVSEPHFDVFEEFQGASYADRYALFCERLVRERLYDATCLLLSNRESGLKGEYFEPEIEFGFDTFARSLSATANAFARSQK